MASYILSLDSVRNLLFPTLSQTGINYRHSSLSSHRGDEYFRVKAGDRMPYVVLDGASIYNWLRQPKFHLLAFLSDDSEGHELANYGAGLIDFHGFPFNDEVAEIS